MEYATKIRFSELKQNKMECKVHTTEIKRLDINDVNSAFVKVSDTVFETKSKIAFLRMMVHKIEIAAITGYKVNFSKDNNYFVFSLESHGKLVFQIDYRFSEEKKYNIVRYDNRNGKGMLIAKDKTFAEAKKELHSKAKGLPWKNSYYSAYHPNESTLIIASKDGDGYTYKIELNKK